MCLAGFVLLLCMYFALGEPGNTNLEQRLDVLNRHVAAVEQRLDAMTPQIIANAGELNAIRGELQALRQQLENPSGKARVPNRGIRR